MRIVISLCRVCGALVCSTGTAIAPFYNVNPISEIYLYLSPTISRFSTLLSAALLHTRDETLGLESCRACRTYFSPYTL